MHETTKHQHAHTNSPRRDIKFGTVVTAIIATLAVIFVLQNTGRGRVTFWFWHITAPAWIWLTVLFLLGVVAGSLAPWLGLFGRSKKH